MKDNLGSYDTFGGWVSDEGTVNYWEVNSGGKFTITENAVYFPKDIGPIDAGNEITQKLIEGYDIEIKYHNNPRKIFIPFFISGVLALYAFVSQTGVAGILLAIGVVFFIIGLFATLRELNTEKAETVVTMKVARDKKTVRFKGEHKEKVENLLDNILSGK